MIPPHTLADAVRAAEPAAVAQNSAPVQRVGRPFPKGTSGNPGGRPKGIRALRERLEAHAEALEDALLSALEDDDPRVRLDAVKLAFSYLYGKPDLVPYTGGED